MSKQDKVGSLTGMERAQDSANSCILLFNLEEEEGKIFKEP